uniref:Uncharacterized protein n=1 Tax=Arundo donax TaxID=35708 RepID=A0A0A9T2Z7_ARUDO
MGLVTSNKRVNSRP